MVAVAAAGEDKLQHGVGLDWAIVTMDAILGEELLLDDQKILLLQELLLLEELLE